MQIACPELSLPIHGGVAKLQDRNYSQNLCQENENSSAIASVCNIRENLMS